MRRTATVPAILFLIGLGIGNVTAVRGAALEGSLSDNQLIESEVLDYSLQYRVYTPPARRGSSDPGLPVLYVTDGQWYIERGRMPQVLDKLIAKGSIDPVIAVFVDNRDPENLSDNRRNQQFFCNPDYAAFFEKELVSEIDEKYPTLAERRGRVVLGLSFGALNSACFGLLARESFQGIAMQSPALHPIPGIHKAWEEAPAADLRIFLSTGTIRDNEASTRRLRGILEEKGYDLEYVEVKHGHDWSNWQPLLDDAALFFFGAGSDE